MVMRARTGWASFIEDLHYLAARKTLPDCDLVNTSLGQPLNLYSFPLIYPDLFIPSTHYTMIYIPSPPFSSLPLPSYVFPLLPPSSSGVLIMNTALPLLTLYYLYLDLVKI